MIGLGGKKLPHFLAFLENKYAMQVGYSALQNLKI